MRNWLIVFFVLVNLYSFSQKNDYNWYFGYASFGYNALTQDSIFGTTTLNFNFNPRSIYLDLRTTDYYYCNASYSDDSGNILMYTDCQDVYDRRDSIMANGGNRINDGSYENLNGFGQATVKGALFLPGTDDSSLYHLFHTTIGLGIIDGQQVLCYDSFFYSTVKIDVNDSNGKMVKIGKVIKYHPFWVGITATKHGNGKDWWILRPEGYSNRTHKFLLSKDTVLVGEVSESEISVPYGDLGTTVFSQDGGKFAHLSTSVGVQLFDFDRCNGDLSNFLLLPFPDSIQQEIEDSLWFTALISFSPSGRFLYAGCLKYICQWDLEAADVAGSVEVIAVYDGYYENWLGFPNQFQSMFFLSQLGPDGKIYICGNPGTRWLHVIHNPDEKGANCNFEFRGVKLKTTNGASMPNFPNYRLGAWENSACDTLTHLPDEVREVKERDLIIYPIPSTEEVTIDYGYLNWSKGAAQLRVYNAMGSEVYGSSLPKYSGLHKIVVSAWPAGIYEVRIERSGQVISVGKIVKR